METFENIAIQQGWNESSQLTLLKRFVMELDIPSSLLEEFAIRIAAQENEQE